MEFATRTLRREHDAILKMLDVAALLAARLQTGIAVPREFLRDTTEFFQLFADRFHHAKEEDILFPALELKGLPRGGGPIAVMLHEHEMGRALVRRMAEAVGRYAADPSAAAGWTAAALEFVSLLRSHIQKENNILFVIAERLLSDAEQVSLGVEFQTAESKALPPGTHDRLEGLAESLSAELVGSIAAR